jgi:hypothetical protein
MAEPAKITATGICGVVTIADGKGVVANAEVQLFPDSTTRTEGEARRPTGEPVHRTRTDAAGRYQFHCEPGDYLVVCEAFEQVSSVEAGPVSHGQITEAPILQLDIRFSLALYTYVDGDQRRQVSRGVVGQPLIVRFEAPEYGKIAKIKWLPPLSAHPIESDHEVELVFREAGKAIVEAIAVQEWEVPDSERPEVRMSTAFNVSEATVQTVGGSVGVTLHRSATCPTLDQALWAAIRNRTHAISFHRFRHFLHRVLRWEEHEKLPEAIERRLRDLGAHRLGLTPWHALKIATEMFLLTETGVRISREHSHELELDASGDSERLGRPVKAGELAERLSLYLGHPPQLPYITRVVETAFPEYLNSRRTGHRLLVDRINEPMLIELIWSYWHEEGMLMQTINAINQRFQNIRRPVDRDPLANMAIDPLRPLSNLMWGFAQDELNRLSVARRAAEYCNLYGFEMQGKAISGLHVADRRSKFLEAFHNLLYQCSVFFKEDFQTTIIADGYPLLNALKEVHLILAQGACNQFGDLPWTARAEMLLVQFMLSRPEMREFLQSRVMVPYKEAWMPQVDAMKTMQGWTDVTVTHFRDLGVYGEQLLLSIRYGDWIEVENEDNAKNWARYHKDILYGYWHAYRAVTGVDLTNSEMVDSTMPAIRLQRRLAMQQRGALIR